MSYRASGVDSITDYNGFSSHRSREVDRVTVYSTFLFNATLLFNSIIYLILILVFCRLCSLT